MGIFQNEIKIIFIFFNLFTDYQSYCIPIKWDNNITLDKSNGLICYEFHKDIQLNEYLYNNEEEGTKINKTIFYNLTELLCKDLNNLSIRFRQC